MNKLNLKVPKAPQSLIDIISKLAAVITSRRTQFSGLSLFGVNGLALLLWDELLNPTWANIIQLPADQQGAAAVMWMVGFAVFVGAVAIGNGMLAYRYLQNMNARPPLLSDARSPQPRRYLSNTDAGTPQPQG